MPANRPADGAPSPDEVKAARMRVRDYERHLLREGAEYVAEFRRAVNAFESAIRAEGVSSLRAVERERDALKGDKWPHHPTCGCRQCEEFGRCVTEARREALEEAAAVADAFFQSDSESLKVMGRTSPAGKRFDASAARGRDIAAAIRALSPGAATTESEGTHG